jgi:hypothetical protein
VTDLTGHAVLYITLEFLLGFYVFKHVGKTLQLYDIIIVQIFSTRACIFFQVKERLFKHLIWVFDVQSEVMSAIMLVLMDFRRSWLAIRRSKL